MFGCLGVALLCALSAQVQAQRAIYASPKELKVLEEVLRRVYNCENEAALRSIDSLKKVWPHHPAPAMLSSLQIYWSEGLVGKESKLYPKFVQLSKQAAKEAHRLWVEYQLPEGLLLEIATRGMLAERSANNSDYLATVSEARVIYKYLPIADSLSKSNPDFYLVVGLYNYFREKYPEVHPIYKPISIFFRSGDKALGIRQVKIAARSGMLSRAEAMTYLAEIYLHYEEQPAQSLYYLRKLHQSYPLNAFYSARLAEAYLNLDRFEEAEQLLEAILGQSSDYFQLYGYYIKGCIEERYYRRLRRAEEHYKAALRYGASLKEKGSLHKANSYLGLARIAEQRANSTQSYAYYKAAQSTHHSKRIHEQAKRGMKRTNVQ